MNDKQFFYIIVFLISMLMLKGAYNLGRESSTFPTPEPTPIQEENRNAPVEHESEWRGYFAEGCVEEGGSETECNCLYDWMRARYTIGEVVELALDSESDEAQSVFDEAGISCMS